MSPPTPEQQDSALAALTGTFTERTPADDLERAMLRVRLIAGAKEKGVPWLAIGNALGGISPQQAKKDFRTLARQTQRVMLLEKARQDGIAPPRHRHARTPRQRAPRTDKAVTSAAGSTTMSGEA